MKKIIVIQFRTDVSELHDQECIRATIPEYAENTQFISAVKDDFPDSVLDDVAGVMLSGSGEFFLGQGHGSDTWLPRVFRFLDHIIDRNIPTLGICFGHQIILKHQGADIEQIEAFREVGTFSIIQKDSAGNDPIFSNLPREFKGMLGHKETPVNLPAHIDMLASSERVEAQAIRIQGKDVWGMMFHPELTRERMKERLLMFPSYVKDAAQLEATLARFEDTPDAGKVISAFVSYAYKKAQEQIL